MLPVRDATDDLMLEELVASITHSRIDPQLVVLEEPSGVGVPAGGSLLPAQLCGLPGLALRYSPQGRKRPRMPMPNSEAMVLRPSRGSSTDDEGRNAQP